MKVFFSLISLCISLGLCHGYCMYSLHEPKIIDDQLVMPEQCTDEYDGRKYLVGEEWNTINCLHCTCQTNGVRCCTRYGGVVGMEGCKAVLDRKACKYRFYYINDPTKLCPTPWDP